MSEVVCFMLERLDEARVSLRRYVSSSLATAHYHNASIVIVDREPYVSAWEGDGTNTPDKTDQRFPKSCACGYEFLPEDEWQYNRKRLYRATDGTVAPPEDHAAGAMWLANWMGSGGWVGADGQTLIVNLPDGTPWVIDGPANNAPGKIPGWDRTGVPPKISATPSIATPHYHGFLTDGVLKAC